MLLLNLLLSAERKANFIVLLFILNNVIDGHVTMQDVIKPILFISQNGS